MLTWQLSQPKPSLVGAGLKRRRTGGQVFLLRAPSSAAVEGFIERARAETLSYAQLGMTGGPTPRGYTADHNRVLLGHGEAHFDRAVEALDSWAMFDLGWVTLHAASSPPTLSQVVVIEVRMPPIRSLMAARVVSLVREAGPVRRHGFAYGTLDSHLERGEERFLIEWDRASDAVFYDLLAYSRPQHLLTWLGYPITRHCQKAFARDSLEAMRQRLAS
jgi:uncharacterized protein (UPF0548 family)